MEGTDAPLAGLWPLALYFAAVMILVTAMIGLSAILGERHRDRARDLPYESGVASMGSARMRFSAKFYQVALFFVVFDIEAVFVFAWAVALHPVGWAGFVEMAIFIVFLLLALIYLVKRGALDWRSKPVPRRAGYAR